MTSSSKTDGAKAFAAWHNRGLTKKTERSPDPNQLANAIVDIATGERADGDPILEEPRKEPAAAALGRKRGGARGDSAMKSRTAGLDSNGGVE
jgi:hypothetical protein